MADISFSGLSSGIDTASLIKALVEAKRAPVVALQKQANAYQTSLNRMNDFGSKLTALRSAAAALASASSFAAFTTSSSNTNVLTVAASSAASEGNHVVTVQQMASGQSTTGAIAGRTVTSADQALGMAGTLRLTPYGAAGVSVPVNSIAVAAGDSLSAIRDKINNAAPTAFGSISFASVPVNGATVTVDGKTYEFSSTGSVSKAGNVLVDTTGAASGADAASRLAAAAVGANKGSRSTMSASGSVVTVTADAGGSAGNLVGMAEEGDTAGAIALSGSSLSGGLPPWSASIVNTGSASAPSWSLLLTGKGMGEVSSFTAAFDPTAPGDPNSLSFTNRQTARDAIVDFDGITGVRRSTNVISDLIAGVTLNLVDAPADKPQVAVGVLKDNGGIRAKVQSFLKAYNDLNGYIRANASFDVATKTAGPLLGDTVVNSVRQTLSGILSKSVTGLTGNYSALSRVGISTGSDGSLSMDAVKFDAAGAADFRGLVDLFAENLGTGTKGVAKQVVDRVDRWMSPVDGLVAIRKTGYQDRIRALNDQANQKESAVTLYESALKTKYANMERLVSALRDQSSALNSLNNF